MFKKQQEGLIENFQKAIPDPMAAFGGIEEWQKRQQEFLGAMMGGWGKKPAPETPEPAAEDLDTIKKQLAELQAKLSKL